jgi:hypothetical protein
LADICVVVDGLGKESRKEFMAWFCTKELQEYNRHFKPGEEVDVYAFYLTLPGFHYRQYSQKIFLA